MWGVVIISLIGIVSESTSQFVQNGQCDQNLDLVENFNVTQFLGTWYEIARAPNSRQNADCATVEFRNTANVLTVHYEGAEENFFHGVNGSVSVNDTAQLTLTLSGFTSPVELWILQTDYLNFALGYFCENVGTTQRNIYVWQLGRQSAYPNQMIPALMNTTLASLFEINAADLESIDHSEDACYILPEINEGEDIILPGQCDPNINVVQNFNVSRFLGLWYQSASYASESSLGTCNRAQYSLGNNGVDVLNSEVVNATLETISGIATVASTDGSARLNVILQITENVTAQQELLILASDYDSYAVSYSCVNLPNNEKRVFSWILSRTRELSANASIEVNQVIDSYLDLNNRYFQSTSQSDADCFYFPEPSDQPVIFRGQCDQNITAVANFDAVRYTGLWHQIEAYPASFQNGTCSNARYTLIDGVVEVLNTQVVNQALDTAIGQATVASTDGSGRLLVRLPIPGTNITDESELWVLDTDYSNYSIAYSCRNLDSDTRQVTSWKLSRAKTLNAQSVTSINNAISGINVLDQRYYQVTDQSREGCFYFPEPQAGVPVVFPGQCNETISVVQNFNLTQFQGIWHEIEAYPKDQQDGQCINHQFIISTNNVLNVISSNVIDQFFTANNGSATVTATDGSAKLVITIGTGNETVQFPYWILGTDYNNYALAYSCVNLDSDFRAVYSWKLSRTKTLIAGANTTINSLISNIEVLDQQYFEVVDQSDDACFYLPELSPGEPIVLVGQCDTNITGIANFDAARYLGTWRVVEKYPSDSQNGTCEEATYTLSANGSVTVFNTEVINQTLVSITGTAVVGSSDGSGVLLVNFPDIAATFVYYILDTDYDNYALVYGCQNLNSEQRRVWSWKMSRTNTFTQNATNSMNQVINAVQVLNNRYYQTVDRSYNGCFYFPTITNDTNSVIFRGQCDETIPAVSNFTVERYLGVWYDIESYPAPFQDGSCPKAQYSLGTLGVNVVNTQVQNETLITFSGIATVASTDGSAKLSVTFVIQGINVTTSLWVLATDYDNYALAYSCSNIDAYYKQVSGWKLSRTKSLLNTSVTAINNVVNTVGVLDDRYFIQRDQSTDGCFYFPEPQLGVPVVFPGQCDTNITRVQNFNLTQFQGIWHEIQAYPKIEQPGQCINHQFTPTVNNTFNLQSSNVNDQSLEITNGVVSFVTNDGSANLVISITVNNTVITIPYTIIATDYNNYALAYSCVNIDSYYRGVWSWKLSRTKQLTAASINAINSASQNIEVLGDRYYENIDQSNDACFYLPELGPNEPVIFPGQCDSNITAVQNFNAARYLGTWRVVEKYPSDSQGGTCEEATYTLAANGSVTVFNTEVINQTLVSITGTAVVGSTDGSGILLVNFPDIAQTFEYYILDTDYDNYALVYGCQNVNSEQRRVWSWKMSRTNTFTQNATNSMNQVINAVQVLNNRYYQTVDRSYNGCFYFPTITNDTNSVIFRGQCDETIPAVANFTVERYLGVWYDIESYPAPFQDGSCPKAQYSLGTLGVNVVNTQVLNETLITFSGIATVASTDGSAKLSVTFVIQGINVTTSLWVLATDYDNYALAYSCSNIDAYYKQVSGWKLSRTKSLLNTSVTAINNVVNTVGVLDDRYFIQRDQSTDGCFYFPEPQLGVPVVFPGQCDTNITRVQNFNLTQFQGIWHEVQAYPKIEQPGQCINHQFTPTVNNTFNLQSSNVNDQSLEITNGVVSFVTNDGSANLVISITVNNTVITIPYTIIATDYNNYALAYSCVNIDSNYRGVWSWKLSRTKQLTAASVNAINSASQNIEVLGDRYYENIDQSNDACFYLPELGPNEPVIFPGQCDSNITAVQNFNAARYLGTWRVVEKYPSDSQGGTCEEATYTLAANGSVTVFNTEVINQTLVSITGTAVVGSTDGSGILLVNFPDIAQTFEYYILDTDYDNYALVYGCQNVNSEQRRVWSWKMSRTNTFTQNATNSMNQVINAVQVLNNRYYQTVDRSYNGCFYFPTITNDTNSVIFRGQCDETIPAVANFTVERYLGVWYDIESYPAPFQDGSCPKAQYSLGTLGVNVVNTQVQNETLITFSGIATVASTDGSAKLSVTFVIQGINVTTSLWVLATDYDNYALAYSCSNIDAYYKQVSGWKLSRTKSLLATSVTAINNVVNTVGVLDDRYFIQRDQSTDGCFYFPEPQLGVPVVFPGQCDTNITRVQNFNLTQFQGIWHEIQAYPKIEQSDQCISHQFTPTTNNTFNLQSFNVNDESLQTTNGVVSFVTNDGSANLAISITVNNTVITIPYTIIATDYNNYALAYSCVNIDSNYRGVWSWKLSRWQTLSVASVNAISTASQSIDVLDERYYESINQSDAACFYYPVLGPNDPVIFPGQCDLNITVVQNFDAARYLGRWRLIESYHSNFQEGTCNEANYSLGFDGTVIVYNTEVINQTLSASTGSAILESSGKLIVTFPEAPEPIEYWILDTDYESYSLVYSCSNLTVNTRRVWSWKMSRENTLSQNATTAIQQTMSTINVLDDRYFYPINRSAAACFYFPDPDGSPVVFRGQCDESIPVVTNFNVTRYLGLWHDIESYPAPFQDGVCANAEYSLNNDGTVAVYNTQVVNSLLDTMSGVAVLATTDGTAKLRVTFEVGGFNVTTDYWVLATDYDNYALVYSCRNIDNEFKQVNSWKLSRQQTLTTQAVTAINAVINTVQVLRQDYYETTGQSVDNCFFYPDNFGGDVIMDGNCNNNITVLANFDINRFNGVWHEISRYPSNLQDGECVSNDFIIGANNTVNVTQAFIINERLNSGSILATIDANGLGVLSTTGGSLINSVSVLDTDYTDYALLYGCRIVNTTSQQVFSWKLSRSRSGLSAAANTSINNIVSNTRDLYEGYYRTTNQGNDGCFYYPIFEQTPTIISLRGPCNETIRGISNFNAAAYLGSWNEISKYPTPDQFGECAHVEYSEGNSVVDVLNTQVLEQALLIQTGSAVVASNDGSGELNVTFVVNGVTVNANYYILATDYTNYALVYSCRNINADTRQVSSWKLSRSTTLNAQALNAMNVAISNTQGLLEDYYLPTSQSDEDCFYIPEVKENEAVVFRGQCAAVNGVQNFDIQRYIGWWHEIERFPSDGNAGQCISSQYRASGNQFEVTDTSVSNGNGTIVTGTVVATANGVLTRTLSNGQTQQLVVLATDYDNYALLYSCENLGNGYRRVWSAKHSKTRQLSQAAQNAIAPLIENNQVLYPQFYLPVDQSDNACFFYPELNGQQVIIPGQCDLNIPVVQNFNAAQYAGTWYQIEKYDQIHESGTCIGARYNLNEDTGIVDVLNWEVINGELVTIEGTATISSTDGSAKLQVILPVVGTNDTVTTSLYVLTTDYESYSLAYSCANINSFQRSIGAWKISRTRTMPAAGATAINAYMATRQELYQPYFRQVQHDDDCEEPSSALLVKSSIIVILVCVLLQTLL